MPLTLEFDHEGRTYRCRPAALEAWTILQLAELKKGMSIVTDLLTEQTVFVDWRRIGVVRLVSKVDARGLPVEDVGPPVATEPVATPLYGAPAGPASQTTADPVTDAPWSTLPPPRQRNGAPPPPGWYPDPLAEPGAFRRRRWDGRAWTEQLD